MERYCPPGTALFVPSHKISPKFKRFVVTSLSLWNQKPKASSRMKTKKTKMLMNLAGVTICIKILTKSRGYIEGRHFFDFLRLMQQRYFFFFT